MGCVGSGADDRCANADRETPGCAGRDDGDGEGPRHPHSECAIRDSPGNLGGQSGSIRTRMIAFVNSGVGDAPPAPELSSSGLTAILFADIVDSTALTERLGDASFRAKAR